jgi:hypothetical protein
MVKTFFAVSLSQVTQGMAPSLEVDAMSLVSKQREWAQAHLVPDKRLVMQWIPFPGCCQGGRVLIL